MNRSEHILDQIIHKALHHHLLNRPPKPPLPLQNTVLQFFVMHARWVHDLSEPGILTLLDLARSSDGWREQARAQFRQHSRAMSIPEVPVIRPTPPPARIPRGRIIHGRFEDHVTVLPDQSVDLVVTSPPYAMQRKSTYGGIPQHKYMEWTSRWMRHVRRVLKPAGSVVININPHIENGHTVDYVRYTIEELEGAGWNYCKNFIWFKPDAPPLGRTDWPRNAYEPILWFSLSRHPYCNSRADGRYSERIGLSGKKGVGDYIRGVSDGYRQGIARVHDVIIASISGVDRSPYNTHTAQFVPQVAERLIAMLSPGGGLVVDPFIGSGTTAVAALATGRHFLGFEKNGGYVNIARRRIKEFRQAPREAA